MYYFAYGVNLNLRKMAEYCHGARLIGPVRVDDHELIFDGQSIRRPGATANVRMKPDSTVWGALFEITDKELEELDVFENYPISYQRKQLPTVDKNNRIYDSVILYFREGQMEGKPGEAYFQDLLDGAYACKLPSHYINELDMRIRSAGFA